VKDFGAVGDGSTDDSAAFLKAINESGGKVIAVPPGRYLITEIVEIRQSGTVLQGAGSERSVLVCPRPLHEIRPSPRENHPAKSRYSWSGGMVWIVGSEFGYDTITAIESTAKRGDTAIELPKPGAGLKIGQTVIISVTDNDQLSLIRYLYAADRDNISNWGTGSTEHQ
jgi:hypothetical protein